jgi:hypothetical protein
MNFLFYASFPRRNVKKSKEWSTRVVNHLEYYEKWIGKRYQNSQRVYSLQKENNELLISSGERGEAWKGIWDSQGEDRELGA